MAVVAHKHETSVFGRRRASSLLIPHYTKHKEEARRNRRSSITSHHDIHSTVNFMVSDSG